MFAKRIWNSLLSLPAMAILSIGASAGEITAYTSLEEDDAKVYVEAFNKEHPDVTVHLLRLSTGDLGARMADAAARTVMQCERVLLIGTDCPELSPDHLRQAALALRSTDAVFITTNKPMSEAKKLPIPTSWEDLLNPVYKGEIVMPNAASSGTGYLGVASLLQMKGEEEGWKFMKELDKNVAQYIKSGSKPCRMASAGEYAIGTSFAFAAVKQIHEGFPITMVIPKEGAGYEIETSGLMKTSKNPEDAKKFLNWLLTPAAAKLYGERAEMNSVPGGEQAQMARDAGIPEDVTSVLFKMDFARSAAEKESILKKWQAEIER